MSDLTAPEKLTAWQRWELPNLKASQVEQISLPSVSEIEALRQQGYDEGIQAGYAAGLQKGVQENQRLADLIALLEQQVDEQVAQSMLELSLEIARQMLQQALKVQPELVLSVIREAIANLPHFNQGAHLFLHPEDAALVRERMGEQLTHSGWKIFEDAQLQRGGTRIETAHSQIDATTDARWKRIAAGLGQDSSWLEQA